MANVTLKDVAELAGVHVSTVSRALDPNKADLVGSDTRAKIQSAAQALGYRADALASGLRRGRTGTLGVVVADLGNPFIAPVVRGIENSLDGRGMMALIAETKDDHARMRSVLESLQSRRVDAIITTAARTGDERLLERTAERVPVVLAVRKLSGSGLPAITHDDERGGRLAAEHLFERGHSRVAELCGPIAVSNFRERAAGFRARMASAAVEHVRPDTTATHPVLSEGRRLMELLLDQTDQLPTGIFAHNDLMAFGALDTLRSHGLSCPEDVAVVGYNDTLMTPFTDPPLTTIRLPGYELGRLAADAATVLIEHPGERPPNLSLPPALVARRSTMEWPGTA